MHQRSDYSLAEAMQYCLQQPGVVAVSFVDIETSRKIATMGTSTLADPLLPFLTDWYLAIRDEYRLLNQDNVAATEYFAGSVGEVKVTLGDSAHLIYPLSHSGAGLCLYLSLGRECSDREIQMPLIRECLCNIDTWLCPLNTWEAKMLSHTVH